MNPYYHQPQNHYSFPASQQPAPATAHRAGWICDPMMVWWSTGTPNPQPPVEYVDEVVILNTPPVSYVDQRPVHSYNIPVPNRQPENTFLNTSGTFSRPIHPFEAAYLENTEQEESLVLEEAINNSSSSSSGSGSGSGLSEETITRHLQLASSAGGGRNQEPDICAICLDEYEKMGIRLECGHGYHAQCIKTWLLRKNVCPMCKATAFTHV